MIKNGVKSLLEERFHQGDCLLIGCSAGAIQMGSLGYGNTPATVFPALNFMPFVFGMHEDGIKSGDWKDFTGKQGNILVKH